MHKIKSFVSRNGRVTRAQKDALTCLIGNYGIIYSERILNLDEIFGRDNPKVIEVGFGNGDSLLSMAESNPEIDYLGIEVYEAGLGNVLKNIKLLKLNNLRVINHDATEVIENMIEKETLSKIQIFFPDPWPKKRHHKRRLLKASFLNQLARRLKLGGLIEIATDWENYANEINSALQAEDLLSKYTDISSGSIPIPKNRPTTKFENRGLKLGHQIFNFSYIRQK